ncbi:DUF2290 domain-containing protein [Vibrio fluvialis]
MASTSAYSNSVKKAKELFKKAGLLLHSDIPHLPSNYVNQVRDLSYPEQWKMHNDSFWYHIKLTDESLILYKPDSFKYFMSPFENLMTVEQYESQLHQDLVDSDFTEEDIIEYLKDIQAIYSDYVDTELKAGSFTPIRVDIHPHQYQKTHHPVTHLHIGHDNESRIPIKKIMNPYAFASFVIATFYPNHWKQLRDDKLLDGGEYASTNQTLESVTKNHSAQWCGEEEEKRFYLT